MMPSNRRYLRRPQSYMIQFRRQGDKLIIRCPDDRLATAAFTARGTIREGPTGAWLLPIDVEVDVHQVLRERFGYCPASTSFAGSPPQL